MKFKYRRIAVTEADEEETKSGEQSTEKSTEQSSDSEKTKDKTSSKTDTSKENDQLTKLSDAMKKESERITKEIQNIDSQIRVMMNANGSLEIDSDTAKKLNTKLKEKIKRENDLNTRVFNAKMNIITTADSYGVFAQEYL